MALTTRAPIIRKPFRRDVCRIGLRVERTEPAMHHVALQSGRARLDAMGRPALRTRLEARRPRHRLGRVSGRMPDAHRLARVHPADMAHCVRLVRRRVMAAKTMVLDGHPRALRMRNARGRAERRATAANV